MNLRRGVFGVVLAVVGLSAFTRWNDMQSTGRELSLAGKKALIVSGTKGIGLGFARSLAKRGAAVTVVGRSEADGHAVVAELNELSGQTNAFLRKDVSVIDNARSVVREYLAANDNQLDVLILCAGIATLQGRTETSDGIDVKLSLHYYSRVAMALEAKDALNASGGVAAFILSAGVHAPAVHADGDWDLKHGYGQKAAADAAGFYTDLAVESLAAAAPAVRWVHACPGFVASNWGEDMPAPLRWAVRGLQAVAGTSIEACAENLSHALFAEERGWFLSNQRGKIVAPLPEQTEENRRAVWEHTLKLIGQEEKKSKI